MRVFAGREAAEEFATGGPFVVNGVARIWTLSEWDEVLTPAPPQPLQSAHR